MKIVVVVQSLSCVWLFVTLWAAHARLPCPSPSPGAYSNSCPLSWWNPPTISSSVIPFSIKHMKERTYGKKISFWKQVLWVPSHSTGLWFSSVQFSSVAQLCLTLCDPMNHSTPGLPVHHQLPEFTQTHVHWVGDQAISSSVVRSPPAPNPSQHQSLFQWVNSSHEVAKVLEFQL